MIVDTSAIVAILRDEPEAEGFLVAMSKAEVLRLSAASYLEAAVVIDRRGDAVSSRRLDDLLAFIGAVIEPVTAEQARIAREACRDFGKGSGHAAGLNFGDCFAYALARDKREKLLFKGTDFARTDVASAI